VTSAGNQHIVHDTVAKNITTHHTQLNRIKLRQLIETWNTKRLSL